MRSPGTWRKARVIFVSTSVIDVALLQLTTVEDIEPCTIHKGPLITGTSIFAIGHGIWGSNHSS